MNGYVFKQYNSYNFAATIFPVKYLFILFFIGIFGSRTQAQPFRAIPPKADSLVAVAALHWSGLFYLNGANTKTAGPDTRVQVNRQWANNDWRFYAAVLLVLLFGLFKTAFRKMYDQLVTLMFRSTVRSRQIKEQLQSTTVPSLAFNLLFVFSASVFLLLAITYYAPGIQVNYFILWLLCIGGVASVYLVKYCWLKMAGWLFNIRETAGTYLFFVFFLNKILGIFLIPLIVLLLLSNTQVAGYLFVISYFLIGFFLLYRYFLAYGSTQKTIKSSPVHFLLYICAVEITPVLLIYKVLFNFLAN
ncbi:MAG: DUF4271 domain-containing protein [Dinghuibacter sp.]|nr:DUF4271 domain-containing protein [Dinghuibacter sp.]